MPPPSPNDAPPHMYCGMEPHLLRQPSCTIRDPNLLRFARRVNSELRLGTVVCQDCYKGLLTMFEVKKKNSRQHRERRLDDLIYEMSEDCPER